MIRTLVLLGISVLCAAQDFSANSYQGKTPPELTTEASQWLNAKAPLTLGGLKGKVVWLEFGFLG
jgi:hypothetical protein